ncbi:hypothetical protein Micbo1qcDRAFT_163485 [Microdochium bolleyi]|uniref:Cytochrome b561 domain-containing protein n=1 Tax=Microdochium bolleyi TaxID=196109 RepID=A0A136J194_9PEZI|nr:hypothetical protein Micbo1qcDRAFT_163485 [Microdochium bolleyi]
MAKTWCQRVLLALAVFTTLAAAQAGNSTNSNTNSTGNGSPSSSSLLSHGALFYTPSRNLAFALSVPQDKSTQDIYFTMIMAINTMWGAVGLGSDSMAGSLMLVVHGSGSGANVTLSPRIAGAGHSEPWYNPDIRVEALPGTTRIDGTAWVYYGVCRNCRTWTTPQGDRRGIDVVSTKQDMIYATGEVGDIWSDDLNYPLRVHKSFGSFTMDMTVASSGGGGAASAALSASPPRVDLDSTAPQLVGTAQGATAVQAYRDWKGLVHAVIMVLVFVGAFPFGAFILRLGGWVRAHAVLQGLAGILFIVGASLGMSISGMYNRTRKFNSAHQVVGLIIFIFVFGQFTLGVLHHRNFKKTQQKTKLAPIHVWLGRLILVLGVINGFLGFTLSQAVFYNYILLGLVLAIFPLFGVILAIRKCLSKKFDKENKIVSETGDYSAGQTGYNLEPWQVPPHLQQQQQHQQQPGAPYPGYSASAGFAPPPAYQGPQQNTREYV